MAGVAKHTIHNTASSFGGAHLRGQSCWDDDLFLFTDSGASTPQFAALI